MAPTSGTTNVTMWPANSRALARLPPVPANPDLRQLLVPQVCIMCRLARPLWVMRPTPLARVRTVPNPGTITVTTTATDISRIVMVTLAVSAYLKFLLVTPYMVYMVTTGDPMTSRRFTATNTRIRATLPAEWATRSVAENPSTLVGLKDLIPWNLSECRCRANEVVMCVVTQLATMVYVMELSETSSTPLFVT